MNAQVAPNFPVFEKAVSSIERPKQTKKGLSAKIK